MKFSPFLPKHALLMAIASFQLLWYSPGLLSHSPLPAFLQILFVLPSKYTENSITFPRMLAKPSANILIQAIISEFVLIISIAS